MDYSTNNMSEGHNQIVVPLLDEVHNLVCLCRGARIDYINPSGRQLLEVDESEDLSGANIADFYHPDYAEMAEISFADLALEAMPMSMKFLLGSGRTLDTEMWISAVAGDDCYLLEVRDVTGHLRSARQLRQREQRLEGIINTVADGIISLDENGGIIAFNPAAEGIFGYLADEVIGQNIDMLLTPDDATEEVSADWRSALDTGREMNGRRKNGDAVILGLEVRTLQQGDAMSYTSVVRDITERKRLEERIHNMAHFDAVTDLPNRNLLSDRLEEATKRAQRSGSQLALMYIDLNKFKPINDEIGHDAGDFALKTVADRMLESVRSSDTVARVGGDEFVILLENVASDSVVCQIADKVIENISRPITFANGPRSIGAAVGIALFPDDGDSSHVLMQCADKAMYVAKSTGKSCYRMAVKG